MNEAPLDQSEAANRKAQPVATLTQAEREWLVHYYAESGIDFTDVDDSVGSPEPSANVFAAAIADRVRRTHPGVRLQ